MRSARANKAKLLSLSQTLLKADKTKLSGRDKLYMQAIDELTNVSLAILKNYQTIFEKVLKAAGKPKSDSQQIEFSQFSSIIRCIEHSNIRDPGYDIIMHHFRLYDDCLALIRRYQTQQEASNLKKLLSENGCGKVEAIYNDLVKKASERLNQTVATYLNTLPEAELRKEAQIIHWLERSKNEMHEDRMIGIIMEFFTTYES